jgi:hypothetical protein
MWWYTQTKIEHDKRIGLSPPTAYPYNTLWLEANKGNLRPKHHIYAVNYYSSITKGYPIFIRGPLLEHPLQEWMMIPQTNNNKSTTLTRAYQETNSDTYSNGSYPLRYKVGEGPTSLALLHTSSSHTPYPNDTSGRSPSTSSSPKCVVCCG